MKKGHGSVAEHFAGAQAENRGAATRPSKDKASKKRPTGDKEAELKRTMRYT